MCIVVPCTGRIFTMIRPFNINMSLIQTIEKNRSVNCFVENKEKCELNLAAITGNIGTIL